MSRYRIGINAGPVHVSRRMGGRGLLGRTLSWFVVKPAQYLTQVIVAGARNLEVSGRTAVRQPQVITEWPPPIVWPSPGLYTRQDGRVMYWDGTRWFG